MNKNIKVAQIRRHLHKTFQLVLFDILIYFLPDLCFLQVPKRCSCLIGRCEACTCQAGCGMVSLSFMLVDFVLDTPLDEAFDILTGLQLVLCFLFLLKLLLFLLLFELSFEVDLFKDSWNCLVLLYLGLDFLWRDKRDVIFQVVKLSNLPPPHIFGILYCNYILRSKWVI